MITQDEALAKLKAAIDADQAAFNAAVIEGLIAAGTEEQWDSGTIESVLEPIEAYLKLHGILPVGTTGDDMDALEFWLAVDGQHLPWDPYRGDRDAAIAAWHREVRTGETEMGLTDWWDDQIETARHNL